MTTIPADYTDIDHPADSTTNDDTPVDFTNNDDSVTYDKINYLLYCYLAFDLFIVFWPSIYSHA